MSEDRRVIVNSRQIQFSAAIKRLFDIAVSLLALIVFGPLLAVIALLIRVDDGGPVFYRGTRVGRFGVLFQMYKFRTMIVNAELSGPSSTAANDPRLTRLGRSLRRYKLDELPQLINVIKGEMSLVGPRPQVEWAVKKYSDEEREILDVRPGITDYASIRFRNEDEILRGSADPDLTYLEKIAPEKNRLALEYARRHSFLLDLKILANTVLAILGRRQQYRSSLSRTAL